MIMEKKINSRPQRFLEKRFQSYGNGIKIVKEKNT